MQELTILGFDHDGLHFEDLLDDARVNTVDELELLAEADIVIAHPDDTKESDWHRLVDGLRSGSVVVRVSSDGRAGKLQRLTDRGAVELQLQTSYRDLTATGLSQIVEELKKPGIGKSIVDGNCPPGLARYFSLQAVEALSILSILCQGYLGAQSCYDDGSAEAAKGVVADALEMMGYLKMIESQRDYVRSPHFWKPLQESLNSRSRPSAKREWIILCGRKADGTKASWGPVKTLLDLLEKNGTPADDVEVVARAYLELAARLGGA
ncbi:MAG: hypothetical protein GY835_03635 [bacterium]|nr:hypothetical protein [bacterium]